MNDSFSSPTKKTQSPLHNSKTTRAKKTWPKFNSNKIHELYHNTTLTPQSSAPDVSRIFSAWTWWGQKGQEHEEGRQEAHHHHNASGCDPTHRVVSCDGADDGGLLLVMCEKNAGRIFCIHFLAQTRFSYITAFVLFSVSFRSDVFFGLSGVFFF